jgi:hypothetical protein
MALSCFVHILHARWKQGNLYEVPFLKGCSSMIRKHELIFIEVESKRVPKPLCTFLMVFGYLK